jgi:hypothetical protein
LSQYDVELTWLIPWNVWKHELVPEEVKGMELLNDNAVFAVVKLSVDFIFVDIQISLICSCWYNTGGQECNATKK